MAEKSEIKLVGFQPCCRNWSLVTGALQLPGVGKHRGSTGKPAGKPIRHFDSTTKERKFIEFIPSASHLDVLA
jgi:hypothetical protein